MKEWQRWEAMARDFLSTGDHRRQAECLNMALELLPPGHAEDKARLVEMLDDARARAVEEGSGNGGGDGPSVPDEGAREAMESLLPEDARESVLREVRLACTSAKGVPEGDITHRVSEGTGLEVDLVEEAIGDLLDEGLLYRNQSGNLMVNGVVGTDDIETAVLGTIAELAAGGRGASRRELVGVLVGRGLSRDEVEEAIDELEEDGRLEEGHPGQLRVALGVSDIEEVHHQVVAAVEEMDPDGKGVLDARLGRELVGRGWDLGEVEEAIEELVDSGDLLRDGGEVRLAMTSTDERAVRERVLELVEALSEDAHQPVPMVKLLRGARRRELTPMLAHRVLDDMVDQGQLWQDERGIHLQPPTTLDPARHRDAVMAAVRDLQHHSMGAPRVEVIDRVKGQGIEEWEVREVLDSLIDEGLVHDTGGGFLRPG
jgi:hypothetical protein